MSKLEDKTLAPYATKGNLISRNMYAELPLPWDCDPTDTIFPREDFIRKEWDRGGKLTDGKDFFGNRGDVESLAKLEEGISTASMVTRWREAHPNLIGTEKDCVKETVRDLRQALGGQDTFVSGTATALLLFRKRRKAT